MPDRDGISIFDLWEVLLRRRLVLIATFAFFFLLAIAYAVLKSPVYRAEVLLIEADDEEQGLSTASIASQFSGLATLAGARIGNNSRKDEAIATLKSRAFIEQFINDNDLLPVLFRDKWDADAHEWDVDEEDEIPTLSAGYELFSQDIMSVLESRDSGLVTVTIETGDPDRAADWANTLVVRLNDHLRQRSINEANRSIAYLDSELKKTSIVELQQAIYNLLEQQIHKVMLANVREEFAFRIIDPAKAPEPDKFVAPKRALAIALGFIGGLLAGVFMAFFVHSFQAYRAARTQHEM